MNARLLASFLVIGSFCTSGQATGRKACAPVQYTYKTVCETVMVPVWETVEREVTVCEYRSVPEKRKVKVLKCVPVEGTEEFWYVEYQSKKAQRTVKAWKCEPVERTETFKYVEHERREKKGTEVYYECVPVEKLVDCTHVVWDRETVKREGTRQVCKWVTVPEERQVCEDQGHWETKCVTQVVRYGCGCWSCCVPVTTTHKVWVSKPVTKTVTVSVCKPKWETEKVTWEEVVCKPRHVTKKVKVIESKMVKRERPCTYYECVPVERIGTRKIICHKWTCEDKIEEYWECVPVKKKGTRKVITYKTVEDWQEVVTYKCVAVPVKRTICEHVCKMVPRTVTRRVCVPVGQ